jgi:hypothetical protein
MADEHYARRPIAGWYTVAAIASLLFMVLGCVSYIWNVTADPATMPLDQRAVAEAVPSWMVAAFAIAVWVGLPASIMLLLRRKVAVPLLLVSLIAVLIQFSAYFLDPELSEVMPVDGLVIPVVILLLTWTIFWFARHSQQRGWLR